MKNLTSTLIASLLLISAHGSVFSQSISITDISPKSPAKLNFNQEVNITFQYEIPNAGGVRVFIRPMTSGRLTPNYAASGSSIYRGRGKETANFTIQSENVTVDQLRVQVLSANQNEFIFEFFAPVDFTFSSPTYTVVKPKLYLKPKKTIQVTPDQLKAMMPTDTSTGEEPEVVRRTVTPEGIIELHYSDGTIVGIISPKQRYFVDPATGDTTYTQMLYSQVQGTEEPASPPGFAATATTNVNDEWLTNLNAWIEYLGSQLLDQIDSYLEDEAFNNYQTFEEKNSSTIYEKVNIRYTFLEKLLTADSE